MPYDDNQVQDAREIRKEETASAETDIVKGHKKAVASFTVGFLSVVFSPLLMGIVGLILAGVGISMSNGAKALLPLEQRDAARMGHAMSIIGAIFSIIMFLLCMFVLGGSVSLLNLIR